MEEQEEKLLLQDKLIQSMAELQVNEDTQPSDDIGVSLENLGARVARDLGRIYQLTEGKANVAFVLEVAALYTHLLNVDPEVITRAPHEIFNEDLIPYLNSSELTIEEDPDGFEVAKPV